MPEIFDLIKVIQLPLSLLICGIGIGIYRRHTSEILKERFKIFSLAFASYCFVVLSEILINISLGDYNLLLLLGHFSGLLFFLLIVIFGILNFSEQQDLNVMKKWIYVLVSAFILLYTASFYINILYETSYSTEIGIFTHIIEILLLLGISVFIIRKIFRIHSPLTPSVLYKKYPFVSGLFLLMISIIVHLTQMVIERTHLDFNLALMDATRTSMAFIALFFLAVCSFRVYQKGPVGYSEWQFLKNGTGELTHLLRIVYYSLTDAGTGERDVLLNEFLEGAKLKEFFDERHITLKEERLQSAIEKKPNFAIEICEGMFVFFKKHPKFLSDIQTQNVVGFISKIPDLENSNEGNLRRLWKGLSEAYKNTTSIDLRKHLEKLSAWGVSPTYAYFEDRHPTGIKRLDEKTGGIPRRSLTLVLKSIDVDKIMLLNPALMANLKNMRNVVYITPDSPAKILSDLGEMVKFLSRGRLKVVSLSPDADGIEEVGQNCYLVKESPSVLVSFLRDFIGDFPLCSIIVLMDLSSLVVKESPSEIYSFSRAMKDVAFTINAAVYACVSSSMDPEKLAILRENARTVVSVDKMNNHVYYRVLKSDLPTAPEPAITGEMFEILNYINKENCEGKNPKFKDVKINLKISHGTTRKRIIELNKKGFLKIKKVGKLKLLEITDDGREFILKHG
jgi:predicted transcriptional regulator